MTPLHLKEVLGDVPQATLYRHVNQLHEGGLLEVVDEQPVQGGVERTYGVVTEAVSLGQSDYRDADADDHMRYFATFLGTLLDSFGAYLEAGDPDFIEDGVGYRQVPLWLTAEEFAELTAALGQAMRSALENEPGEGRTRRLISTIVMPDARAPD